MRAPAQPVDEKRARRNRAAKERMAEWRKTEAYRDWLGRSREMRRLWKEKYRREKGARPRAELLYLAEKRRAQASAARAEKLEFERRFIGPPRPTEGWLGAARYQRWRYHAFPDAREKQIAKRRRHVREVSFSYARERLGLVGAPEALIAAKQLCLRIERVLGECDEDD